MKNCTQIREYFPEALYGELSDPVMAVVTSHLKECPSCAAEYEKMKQTLSVMSVKTEEFLTAQYWDSFTDRVMEKVEQNVSGKKTIKIPRWLYQAAAAAALIILGMFLGRLLQQPVTEMPVANTGTPQDPHMVQTVSVKQEAAQYLEKSKILILGVVNMDTETVKQQSMDSSRQQQLSRQLVAEAAVLKKKLSESDQMRLRALVAELELILMQMSNYEQEFDVPAIELIRSSVDNQGVLMKINVEEMILSNKTDSDDEQDKNKIRL